MSDSNQDRVANYPVITVLREVCAVILWTFILVKLIAFDIDIYVVEKYVPALRWALNYRFFGLLLVISFILLGIRKKPLRQFLIYVATYPIIVFFWRLPKLFFRNWALTIAFAPAIYDMFSTFRSRFVVMTIAIFSALCIILSSRSYLLVPAMVLLGIYLIMNLYRSLRKAYQSSVFEGLGDLVKKLRVALEGGQQGLWKKGEYDPETKDYEQQCLTFYLLNWGAELMAEKLLKVAKSRKPDLYLMFSWLGTVLVTSLIYALEYWALYKIDMLSYRADRALAFWDFWGFSFGKLTPSSISGILPLSLEATILSYSELFCALIILVILVFSVLTAARERYRDDIAYFVTELRSLGNVMQDQFSQLYAIALADVEKTLLHNNAALINKLRKARGLPSLSLPEKDEKTQDRATSVNEAQQVIAQQGVAPDAQNDASR